jgi:hypothetical protein
MVTILVRLVMELHSVRHQAVFSTGGCRVTGAGGG